MSKRERKEADGDKDARKKPRRDVEEAVAALDAGDQIRVWHAVDSSGDDALDVDWGMEEKEEEEEGREAPELPEDAWSEIMGHLPNHEDRARLARVSRQTHHAASMWGPSTQAEMEASEPKFRRLFEAMFRNPHSEAHEATWIQELARTLYDLCTTRPDTAPMVGLPAALWAPLQAEFHGARVRAFARYRFWRTMFFVGTRLAKYNAITATHSLRHLLVYRQWMASVDWAEYTPTVYTAAGKKVERLGFDLHPSQMESYVLVHHLEDGTKTRIRVTTDEDAVQMGIPLTADLYTCMPARERRHTVQRVTWPAPLDGADVFYHVPHHFEGGAGYLIPHHAGHDVQATGLSYRVVERGAEHTPIFEFTSAPGVPNAWPQLAAALGANEYVVARPWNHPVLEGMRLHMRYDRGDPIIEHTIEQTYMLMAATHVGEGLRVRYRYRLEEDGRLSVTRKTYYIGVVAHLVVSPQPADDLPSERKEWLRQYRGSRRVTKYAIRLGKQTEEETATMLMLKDVHDTGARDFFLSDLVNGLAEYGSAANMIASPHHAYSQTLAAFLQALIRTSTPADLTLIAPPIPHLFLKCRACGGADVTHVRADGSAAFCARHAADA